ncbi:MAG: GTP-binding protein [Clostridioides sp.]|jgi:G3E family GTPase|nr:GTP-binding protein [Clostridioides sp.]
MVDLFVVSGFLGSGKTTFIKKMLEIYKNKKIAIIENEFGEVGIDGELLKNDGINVVELKDGCICCSIKLNFVKNILEIINSYNPEVLIIEPTGVSMLSEVLELLENEKIKSKCNIKPVVTIVDVINHNEYIENFGLFYEDQIEYADILLLSKMEDFTRKITTEENIIENSSENVKEKLEGNASEIKEKLEGNASEKKEKLEGSTSEKKEKLEENTRENLQVIIELIRNINKKAVLIRNDWYNQSAEEFRNQFYDLEKIKKNEKYNLEDESKSYNFEEKIEKKNKFSIINNTINLKNQTDNKEKVTTQNIFSKKDSMQRKENRIKRRTLRKRNLIRTSNLRDIEKKREYKNNLSCMSSLAICNFDIDSISELENIFKALKTGEYGKILRIKGFVKLNNKPQNEELYEFNYVNGKYNIKKSKINSDSLVCIIGQNLEKEKIKEYLS